MNGMAASDKIFRLLDLDEPVHAAGNIDPEDADIRLNHIEFSYDVGRPVLEDVSLSIPKGKFVSIAGESGSGKVPSLHLLWVLIAVTAAISVLESKI